MPTTAVSSLGTTGTTSTTTAGLAGVTGNDFMNIMIKQLQMQDPFKPMTNEEMVSQLSTIRELEMNTRMSSKLEQLTDQQRFGSAAALIGKKVSGTVKDENGNEFSKEGIVTGVRFNEDGSIMLELDSGDVLPMTALDTVHNLEAAQATTK